MTLRAPSGYTQYALSNTTTLPKIGTAMTSAPIAWTLDSGDGAKTVYAQFFKADGTASGVYSAGIVLDSTAPAIVSVKATGKKKVRVIFSEAVSTLTASNVLITPALSVASVTKESDTSYLLTLATGIDTTKTYSLATSGITDAAGNVVASDSVTFDRKPIETIYIYHGSTRIAKRTNGVTTFLLQDHLGSTVATTDSTGKLLSRTTYTPYGSVATESGDADAHKFTGKELDPSTGLYDYEARQYDAALGRFISADTATPNYNDPQSLNRYSYCQNNPVKYIDPTGHFATPVDIAFMAMDFGFFLKDPTLMNATFLAIDAIPMVPSAAGLVARGIKAEMRVAQMARQASEVAKAEKRVTVIGRLNAKPSYIDVAKKQGANYLKIQKNGTWSMKMNDEFISSVAARGDDVMIGTPIGDKPSVLRREIKQLLRKDYQVTRKEGKIWLKKGD